MALFKNPLIILVTQQHKFSQKVSVTARAHYFEPFRITYIAIISNYSRKLPIEVLFCHIFKPINYKIILKIYNTLVLPTFLYGSENWTLWTLYDHKTNDYILRELRITGILDDEYGRNWLLHLQRMPQNRIPLKSYRYRPQGRRTIGRPKKRWREQL